ncbi:SHOCT domain-containing protein [Streptomyces sp. L2]|uniref:SHOCT domain-containing protein n=1 Tax=Streptomyces sp. L2 TaxID=2162665 RepID=UPI0010139ADF|nr:SHOCT domain-containing protein [Streptomyces sp. L2]
MELAYDYPLLSTFWTMLWFFLWIMWFVLLFRIIGDIFRDDDLSGWGKTGWMVFVLVLPFLGAFVYVIARGRSMGHREIAHARAQQAELDSYIRKTAGDGGPRTSTDELARLADLRAGGQITDEEFRRAKDLVLSETRTPVGAGASTASEPR